VGQIIQLSQRLPFPGKRPLQGLIALAEADALQEDYEAVRLNLALIVSQLYDDYYVVERALEINTQHQALLHDLQRAVEAQYIVGRATQQDVIQAEAERQYYPDLTLMGTYNSLWEAPERRFTLGAAVNLPVQRARRQAAVAEAQARQARMEQVYSRLVDTVRVEVEQVYHRLLEAHQAARLYQDRLLPAARDRIAAAQAGFEAGRTLFLTLIEAEKYQRLVTLQYHEILAALYRRQAQLDRAVGRMPGLATLGETS
jgi:outer membrane protein TolC